MKCVDFINRRKFHQTPAVKFSMQKNIRQSVLTEVFNIKIVEHIGMIRELKLSIYREENLQRIETRVR